MAVVIGDKKSVNNTNVEIKPTFICDEDDQSSAKILLSLVTLGIGDNVALMAVILLQKPLRR